MEGLKPELLLDTNAVMRWLGDQKHLSGEQLRVLRNAVARGERFAVSAVTLLEIGVLPRDRRGHLRLHATELLAAIASGEEFEIVPLDIEIATEVAAMGDALRDPADRAIVATARVHGLRLVTSDERIIDSKLARVVE